MECDKCGTVMTRKVCPSCGWKRRSVIEQMLIAVVVVGGAVGLTMLGLIAIAKS